MNEYLMIAHEMEKARLLTRNARKERSSPAGSPPEGNKSTGEGEKAINFAHSTRYTIEEKPQ